MKEIWKDVVGYEGLYQVSNLGRIKAMQKRGHKSVVMKYSIRKDGYCRILLSKNSEYKALYVHRLVAEAFLTHADNECEVNHIDGNKANNNLSNLEWVTRSDNIKHALKCGLKINPTIGKFGGKNPNSKKVYQYDLKNNLVKVWDSASEAERFGGFCANNIYACITKKRTYKGFIWKHE